MKITQYALNALQVDAHGLDEMDNKILTTLIDKFKGGPVGITTLATAVSENGETIEEVYEPFLDPARIYSKNSARQGSYSEIAYTHLGTYEKDNQGGLVLRTTVNAEDHSTYSIKIKNEASRLGFLILRNFKSRFFRK